MTDVGIDLPALTRGALFLALGAGTGLAYFAMLRRGVALLVAGGGAAPIIALMAGRTALATAALGLAALQGALPLLALLLGLLIGRRAILRRAADQR